MMTQQRHRRRVFGSLMAILLILAMFGCNKSDTPDDPSYYKGPGFKKGSAGTNNGKNG